MKENFYRVNEIQIHVNIPIGQIISLSIRERVNAHTVAEIVAEIEAGSLNVAASQLNSQPIAVTAMKDGDKKALFFGVIGQVRIAREAGYETIYVRAYSLSWLMDLEKKSRSFQGDTSILHLLCKVSSENAFSIQCFAKDQMTGAPFIQYRETDWEFMVRLSTHLQTLLYPAGGHEGKGLYLGMQEQEEPLEIVPLYEKWRVDAEYMRIVDHDVCRAVYYEVMSGQVFHLGQSVCYDTRILWPFEVEMILQNGMLHCISKLMEKKKKKIPVRYCPHIKGADLSGTVLKRKDETVYIHLDIDKEQEISSAYEYPWFPEHGNLVYCMPEEGSMVRLHISGKGERDAVCIGCVRQGGKNSKEFLEPANRWFVTAQNKKLVLRPSLMELTGDGGDSVLSINDAEGNILKSSGGISIQAKGCVAIQGTEVTMNAPKEITAVKRELGEPAVVNICYNLDATGKQTEFNNLPALSMRTVSGSSSTIGGQVQMSEEDLADKKEKAKKLRFELQELFRKEKEKNSYELGDSIIKIISAIPQCSESDQISRIAMGFRPVAGRMGGE